jgi:hypothetical protein
MLKKHANRLTDEQCLARAKMYTAMLRHIPPTREFVEIYELQAVKDGIRAQLRAFIRQHADVKGILDYDPD